MSWKFNDVWSYEHIKFINLFLFLRLRLESDFRKPKTLTPTENEATPKLSEVEGSRLPLSQTSESPVSPVNSNYFSTDSPDVEFSPEELQMVYIHLNKHFNQ